MRVTLFRIGVPVAQRKADDQWKQWAYEAALEQRAPALTEPVELMVTPCCVDKRGRTPAGQAWPFVDAVIDGLIAAGVLRDREAILSVTMRRSMVNGESGLKIELSDSSEPF